MPDMFGIKSTCAICNDGRTEFVHVFGGDKELSVCWTCSAKLNGIYPLGKPDMVATLKEMWATVYFPEAKMSRVMQIVMALDPRIDEDYIRAMIAEPNDFDPFEHQEWLNSHDARTVAEWIVEDYEKVEGVYTEIV